MCTGWGRRWRLCWGCGEWSAGEDQGQAPGASGIENFGRDGEVRGGIRRMWRKQAGKSGGRFGQRPGDGHGPERGGGRFSGYGGGYKDMDGSGNRKRRGENCAGFCGPAPERSRESASGIWGKSYAGSGCFPMESRGKGRNVNGIRTRSRMPGKCSRRGCLPRKAQRTFIVRIPSRFP